MTCINVKFFPAGVRLFGLSTLFWIHSGICICLCIIGMLILPETQGKTLTEISEMYLEKPKFKNTRDSFSLKDTNNSSLSGNLINVVVQRRNRKTTV